MKRIKQIFYLIFSHLIFNKRSFIYSSAKVLIISRYGLKVLFIVNEINTFKDELNLITV